MSTVATLAYTMLSVPLYDLWGAWSILPLYTGPSIACTAYMYWYLPETQGRDIDDIVADLAK